ncbi:MAG TPA: hypothetical protein VK031_05160, partial [Tissierellaceae bacterium]|nr:hypothetical protein [Tissierellaceae bacterium]
MKRLGVLIVCLALILTSLPIAPIVAFGEESTNDNIKIDTSGYTVIDGIEDYEVDGSKITLKLKDGNKTQISFLSHNIFRYYVDINDSEFLEYPNPRSRNHEATIVARPDSDWFDEVGVRPVVEDGDVLKISTDKVTLLIDKKTSQLTVKNKSGEIVLEEVAPIMYKPGQTIQSLSEGSDEYFFGGGMQNGRFTHKGESIKIENTNNWVDGGVASPNPFYWSTKGYGVVRNTFQPGEYDFGNTNDGIVQTRHNENRFDAYIFVADDPVGILNEYTNLTGKPAHLPDYAFYLSHLNCYNRDAWKEVPKGTSGAKHIDGKYYVETNRGG